MVTSGQYSRVDVVHGCSGILGARSQTADEIARTSAALQSQEVEGMALVADFIFVLSVADLPALAHRPPDQHRHDLSAVGSWVGVRNADDDSPHVALQTGNPVWPEIRSRLALKF